MKKIFKEIHLWLSIPFGIIITLICLTGALMVFETEIKELTSPELYYVDSVGEKCVKMEDAVLKVGETLPEEVTVTGISVSSDPERAWKVNLSKPRHAAIYFDQYTGEIKGESPRGGFWATVRQLHRWLLLQDVTAGEISLGKIIVGGSTIAFIFVLISGVVTWWPRTMKGFKNSLKIVAKKGWWRFWHSLHIAGGVYAVLLLLVMALTGLTWSYEWYRNGFYSLFGVEVAAQGNKAAQGKGGDKKGGKGGLDVQQFTSPYIAWDDVCAEVASKYDDYKQITISNGKATVSLAGFGNQRASDSYTFDTRTGDITSSQLYADSDKQKKIGGWIYSLHVGSWGGVITKLLTLFASLLGAALAITGYYLWIRRKFFTAKNRKDA